MVTLMLENSRFRTPFESQRVHGFQTLLKSGCQKFRRNFPLSQNKLSYKTSLLLRCEILGLFGNTVIISHMYSCHNSEKLPRDVQTPFSEKPSVLSQTFDAFFQST